MKVAILGSGFGLYGYLPGLGGRQVVLPERYKATLEARSDVRHLGAEVEWVKDEDAALRSAGAVIVAQRPADQIGWIEKILTYPGIRAVLLEKPLAPDPLQSAELLRRLVDAERRVRVGYTLRYTGWGRKLLACLSPPRSTLPDRIEIIWKFRAHHYANGRRNWKRHVSTGGGALRFYGIHLIALLAEAGYDGVTWSMTRAVEADEAEAWHACLTGPDLPTCTVEIESNAGLSEFRLCSDQKVDKNLRDPFDDVEPISGFDRRVAITSRLCDDLLDNVSPTSSWYQSSIDFWRAIEERNCFLQTPTLPQSADS